MGENEAQNPGTVGKAGEDVSLKTIELRLASVKEAMQRTRFVFIVITIASSAILFTLWNDRFSRDKSLAFSSPSYAETPLNHERPVPLHVWGRRELVSEWYKNRIIQIGLLGIRLSVGDLSLIGSFGLVVITIWFYYSHKRENKALVTLLRDVHQGYKGEEGLAVRNMVYQEIRHNLVFIKTEESDAALDSLEETPAARGPAQNLREETGGGGQGETEGRTEEVRTFTDRVLRFLSFLPFWTILAIIVRDISALLMASPTANSEKMLVSIIWSQVKCTGYGFSECLNSLHPLILVVIFAIFSLGCAVYTRILCKRSRAFAEGSKKALKQFEQTLRPPARAQGGVPGKG
jgi:hypothetical protein